MISVGWAVTTRLDAEAADGAVQGLSTRRSTGPRERFFDRGRLRTGARITLIRPAPANAMMLFGDVGEVQEVREAARDRQHRFDHRPQLGGERLEPVRRRHAGPLGERADALHALEGGCPSWRRSVSPSSSPSKRTSSRNARCGSTSSQPRSLS